MSQFTNHNCTPFVHLACKLDIGDSNIGTDQPGNSVPYNDDYATAKWLALHSLKSHPSREDTVVFKGFANFDEDGVDDDSIEDYLNEEKGQLLLQQQPKQEPTIDQQKLNHPNYSSPYHRPKPRTFNNNPP